jgi:hypothetical protein
MGMFGNDQGNYHTPQNPTEGTPQHTPYANAANPFERIGNSQPTEGGVYPIPGVYPLLYVNTLKMIKSRKGEDVFIADFDIVTSDVPERPAGSVMSWVCNFKHDAAPGNVRLLLAAVTATPLDQVDAAGSQFAVSPQNPCHGRLVRLTASQTITKSGNPFTVCKWDIVSEEHQQRADEYRKQAGFDAHLPR